MLGFATKVRQREFKILIVDDEAEARELLATALEPLGITAIMASSGEEALQLARQLGPDPMILDLVMPGMNGFEVLKSLRADLSTRAIPVLVVTAKDISETEKAVLNGDVEAVLGKDSLASMDLAAWLEESIAIRGFSAGHGRLMRPAAGIEEESPRTSGRRY